LWIALSKRLLRRYAPRNDLGVYDLGVYDLGYDLGYDLDYDLGAALDERLQAGQNGVLVGACLDILRREFLDLLQKGLIL